MLTLNVPRNCMAERAWIADVVLREFLGLPVDVVFSDTDTVTISAAGRVLELPDVFFSTAAEKWLWPIRPLPPVLPHWDVASSGLQPESVDSAVPVLFGSPGYAEPTPGKAVLRLDVLGTAFFMLSRYEECTNSERDEHGRFPAAASLAYRCGFLHRPIVDEYVEILWAAMSRMWPTLVRRKRNFRMLVSCDVDHPYDTRVHSPLRTMKRAASELWRTLDPGHAATAIANYFASRRGNWENDPYYYTVDWMMDVNEQAGNRMAFYFIPEVTDPRHDDTCPLHDRALQQMMRRIDGRAHEIGLHPGYNTFDAPHRIVSGKTLLQSAVDRARLRQQIAGGRHHYLRWSTRTPASWEAAGLEYDSTLGYAEHAGFRCGTCHEYPMYDLHRRRALKVRQRPLICMEASVIRHMGYGTGEQALAKMMRLKASVQRMRGNFTLLWHNSALDSPAARDPYRCLIQG